MTSTQPSHLAAATVVLALVLGATALAGFLQAQAMNRTASALERQARLDDRARRATKVGQALQLSEAFQRLVSAGGALLDGKPSAEKLRGVTQAYAALDGELGLHHTATLATVNCRLPEQLSHVHRVRTANPLARPPLALHVHAIARPLPEIEPALLDGLIDKTERSPQLLAQAEEMGRTRLLFKRDSERAMQDPNWLNSFRRSLLHSVLLAAACRAEAERELLR